MERALTNRDLIAACDGEAKIVVYPDLAKYRNIDELLEPYGHVFLLYEFEKNVGHWTLVFRCGDGSIEHFDSYSYMPDAEMEFIPKDFRRINKMLRPRLAEMLRDAADGGAKICYNQFELQKEGKNIMTCGRHCLVRWWLKDLAIEQYYDLMRRIRDRFGCTYDDIVVALT